MLALERLDVAPLFGVEPRQQAGEQARFLIVGMLYAARIEKTDGRGDRSNGFRFFRFVFRGEPFARALECRQTILNAPVTGREMLNGAIDSRGLLSDFDHAGSLIEVAAVRFF